LRLFIVECENFDFISHMENTICLQTEQKFISEVEKAETDMSASAVKNMCRTAARMVATAVMAAVFILKWMKD